ncbi:AraC family transcriptional regulator [Bradyrhizobium sp.]|uniref:AraC family transcriptional regulator n=1 Tax=Bradyrhizobium sp. TaxID=376 RepID=UPI00260288B7|nr:AraC family transcriptional regulator [Bradyrhizobium sp.]
MTDLIRSATLMHYAETARSVGLEPTKMLRKVRLPLACLDDQNMRVAVSSVRRLLEVSAAESGVEDFALRLAGRGSFATLGPVGLVVREQATVRAALEALARFIHIQDEAMRLEFDHGDEIVTIGFLLRGATRQSTELALGRVHTIIRLLFSGDWRPVEVCFMHSPPRHRRHHQQFFGCHVAFNAEIDAIRLAASDLDYPIKSANPTMARYLLSRVEAITVRPESWDGKVGELVRSLLPGGRCTIERVAEHLACDRRTVHRRLLDCGISFSAILNEQRAKLVMRLIEDGNRPLAEIAELLGFSAQSAMARWFRGHFGCSITQWRKGVRPTALSVEASRAAIGRSRPARKPGQVSQAYRRSKKLER